MGCHAGLSASSSPKQHLGGAGNQQQSPRRVGTALSCPARELHKSVRTAASLGSFDREMLRVSQNGRAPQRRAGSRSVSPEQLAPVARAPTCCLRNQREAEIQEE